MDYDALAKQSGAVASVPTSGGSSKDYDTLAKSAGAVENTAGAPTQKDHGFAGNVLAGVLKLPARLLTNVANAGQIIAGKPQTQPFSGSYFGEVPRIGAGLDITKAPWEPQNVAAIKDSAGAGVEAASYVVGGPEIKGGIEALKGGELLAKPTLKAIVQGGKAAVVPGALYAGGESMQDPNKNLGQNLEDAAVGGIVGGATGGTLAGAGKVLEKTGIPQKLFAAIPGRAANVAAKATADATDHANNVTEMTRDILGTGVKEVGGKKVPTGMGAAAADKTDQTLFKGSKAQPSANELRRGQAVAPYIEKGAKPVQAEEQLTQAGTNFANNTMKPFLEEKAAPVNFQEVHDYMHNTPKPTAIGKDPVKNSAFTDTINEAIDLITGKSSTGKRDLFNGFDINEARKSLDTLAKRENGVYDVGSPRNTGAKAAIDAIRGRINQLNEDSIKYGDITKVNSAEKAFNAFKEHGVRTEGTSDAQLREALLKREGAQSTPESEQAASTFQRYLQHQKDILEARNNLRVKNAGKVGGPSKIKEVISNPLVKKAGKLVLPLAGLGTLAEIVNHK